MAYYGIRYSRKCDMAKAKTREEFYPTQLPRADQLEACAGAAHIRTAADGGAYAAAPIGEGRPAELAASQPGGGGAPTARKERGGGVVRGSGGIGDGGTAGCAAARVRAAAARVWTLWRRGSSVSGKSGRAVGYRHIV